MERRLTPRRPETEEQVTVLLFRPPPVANDGREGPPGGWRRRWASLWPIALQVALLLLFGTGMAAQTMIFARADGLAEAFAGLMDYLGFVGGLIAGGGLIWAGLFLRDRDEAWARSQIPGGVAAAAAGIALIAAARAISVLSASGAIPIP